MAIGVNPIDQSLNRQAMAAQADLFQQLGAQIRTDMRVIQTNQQLRGFANEIQSVDPTSPDYAQRLSGVMAQFPLAAQSPLGAAAINQLGAQRNFYQQQFLADRAADRLFDRQIGMLAAGDYLKNRSYGSGPASADELRGVANSSITTDPPTQSALPAQTSMPAPEGNDNALFDVNGALPSMPSPSVPASAPIDNIGARISQFREQLIRDKVPAALGETMLQGYARDLMRQGTSTTGVTKRQLADGSGEVWINPDGTTRTIPYPQGSNVRVPGASVVDPNAKALLDRREDIAKELRKIQGLAQAHQGAWQSIPWDDEAKKREAQAKVLAAGRNAKFLEEELRKVDAQLQQASDPALPANPAPSAGRMRYTNGTLVMP